MKQFVFVSLFICSCASSKKTIIKQPYPSPFEFILIDTLPETKAELYVKSYDWLARTYVSAKTIIDMQDKDAGKIIAKAIIDLDGVKDLSGEVKYLIAIDTKDGKYRCTISDFYHTGPVLGTTRHAPVTVRSYGDLNKEKFTYKSPAYNKILEDKRFYLLKNYVLIKSNTILESLKQKMRDNSNNEF